jgi:hypothetical protein
MLILSLGGVYAFPPNTFRGRIVNAAALKVLPFKNIRLFMANFLLLVLKTLLI